MNIKEKLAAAKKAFLAGPKNRDYEFVAELENHPRKNLSFYRLHFVNYHRIREYEGRWDNIGVIDWPFDTFMLPVGMTEEDAFKVLSYLTDFIESNMNIEPCSFTSVELLDKALDLPRFGFIKLKNRNLECNDLFTVSGRVLLFKNSKDYKKYFEWYTEGVTFDEVKEIYAKIGLEFDDLVILPKEEQITADQKLTRKH